MLWTNIYNFFVQYVFGGFLVVNGTLTNYGARLWINTDNPNQSLSTSEYTFDFLGKSWQLGNYLSFIATLISMVVIVILCCLLIKKIYNICAHIIG